MSRSAVEAARFLASVRLFRQFSEADRVAVAARLGQRTLRQGQVLFREGEPGEEMFIVRRGTIVVSKAVTGKVEQVLSRLTTGDFFGEMSLFDQSPRSATIQSETDVTLLVLDRLNFQELITVNPRAAVGFLQALVQVFIERLRKSTELVAEVTRWGLEATGLDVEPR